MQAHGYIDPNSDTLVLMSRPQNGEPIATKNIDARAPLGFVEDGESIIGGSFCAYINDKNEWRLQGSDRLVVSGVDTWGAPNPGKPR